MLKSRIANRNSKVMGGFTLIELLVVISIITIMLGLGVLAFNALTGRKSTAMARNQIAAMLGKARAIAINDQSGQSVSYGVVFFRDPETERTAMAIARRDELGGGGDPDPHDNYKAWMPGVSYQPGDRVVAIVADREETGTATGGTPMAVRFRCLIANTTLATSPGAATRPPPFRPDNTSPPLFLSAYPCWMEVVDGGISYPDEPVELLPVGVGVQVITDPGEIDDRYVRTGAIFFDRRGQMDHLQFGITQGSPVGLRMGLTADMPPVGEELYSGVGVAIYDNQLFTSAGHTEDDYDLAALLPSPNSTRPAAAAEETEERWVDDNANLLTVDRYSGELSQVR